MFEEAAEPLPATCSKRAAGMQPGREKVRPDAGSDAVFLSSIRRWVAG